MSLLYLVLAWLGGIGLVRWLWPVPWRGTLPILWLAGLGAGIGMGVASTAYFLCLSSAGPNIALLASVEGAIVLVAIALALRVKRQGPSMDWASGPAAPWYLPAALIATAAAAAIMFLVYSMTKPHGEWDAWSIWNLRARFLFRSGQFWKDAFTPDLPWAHPEYPLLVPGTIAMLWTLAKSEWTVTGAALGLVFVFAGAAVLIATLGILRGRSQALVAGILLLGTGSYVQAGAMQYADDPLGFYILAAFALLCLQERYPSDLRFTLLAGLCAGFAAWTKNEGLLFVAALIAGRAFATVRFGNRTGFATQWLRLGAGLIGPLAIVGFFKLRFAPRDGLLSIPLKDVLSHAADVSRWLVALEGYVKMVFRFGGFLIPVVLILMLYWYLVRFQVEKESRLPLATILATIAVMLAGDFAVYVLLPGDVAWQLNTSLDRIFLQLWPAGLLAFFLAANVPQLASKPAEQVVKPKREKRARR